MGRSATDECAAALAEVLAPYAWREFTDRMLARRTVGAVDRHQVVAFLAGVPGTDVGECPTVEPAEAGDERVDALLRSLHGKHWRGWSLARLCTDLTCALDAWQTARTSFDSDVRRLHGGR